MYFRVQNMTAIVDKDNSRCFIIPLNRTMVKPPKDFWDLLSKLRVRYWNFIHVVLFAVMFISNYLLLFKRTKQTQCVYTLSKTVRHVASIFQFANLHSVKWKFNFSLINIVYLTNCILVQL